MPLADESIIGLPDFKIVDGQGRKTVEFAVEYMGVVQCPYCSSQWLRKKDSFLRRIKHHSIGLNNSCIWVKAHKYQCRECRKYFNSRFPGILPNQRATEPFKEEVAIKHHMGHCKSKLAQFLNIGSATVERWYQEFLKRQFIERTNAHCPKILGIDEKHFTKRLGYLTTFADLRKHKVYDLALGRSEASLEGFIKKIPNRSNCRVIVMDLSETFRNLARKFFSTAMIVADRFHVVKLINHHFLKTWAILDKQGRKNRGLLSLMRRHPRNLKDEAQRLRLRHYLRSVPGLEAVYDFKQKLMDVILSRVYSRSEAQPLVCEFLEQIAELKYSGFEPLQTLGHTLESWQMEIVRMWRFSKTNSITEGLHTRMEEILRRAYGMRNFDNFKIRVKAFCG